MLFNSLTFLVFLAIVLPIYYSLKHRGQNWFLLAASYFFYGWWSPRFLLLLVATNLFDYYVAVRIEQEPRPRVRKWLLAASMTINLGVLALFKYFNFFAEGLHAMLSTLGFR